MKVDATDLSALKGAQLPIDGRRPDAVRNEQAQKTETSRPPSNANAPEDVKVELSSKAAAEQFNGAKVQEAVLKHVQSALANARERGLGDDEIEDLRNQALQGVKQGFNEANDVLKEMNTMSPELAQKIDSTLADIEKAIKEDDFSMLSNQEKMQKVEQEGGFVSQGYFRNNQSLNLLVRTRDGDQIQISLSQDREAYSQLRGDGNQLIGQSQLEQSGALQFSVTGDLSQSEQSALKDIISQVGSIANRFFNGEVDSAFDLAKSLDISGTELSELSLNLQETTTAIATYGEVGNQNQGNVPKALAPLADYVDELVKASKFSEDSGFDRLMPIDLLAMLPEASESRLDLLEQMRDVIGSQLDD